MFNFDIKLDSFSVELCKSVHQYPYRTASVRNRIFTADRNSEACRAFESFLANKSGKFEDNHTAYRIILRDGGILYVECSDQTMSFGLSIQEESW